MPNPVLQQRARVATAVRLGRPEEAQQARGDLAVAKIEQHVAAVVAAAPPLTPEQRDRIASILARAGRDS